MIKRKFEGFLQDSQHPSTSTFPHNYPMKGLNISTIRSLITSAPIPIVVMASIFAPLVLPSQQHDLPQNYSQRKSVLGKKVM